MPRHVTHIMMVEDLSKLRDGDYYESFCGKRFIACDPPTAEEIKMIEAKRGNDPVCRKCATAKAAGAGGEKMRKKKIEVEQVEGEEVAAKVLANSIVSISDSAEKLLKSGLNRRAITVLIKDSSGVTLSDITKVLDAMKDLKKNYCQ